MPDITMSMCVNKAHYDELAAKQATAKATIPDFIDFKKEVDSSLYILVKRSEYEKLTQRSQKLEALELAGVDYWEGYDMAMETFYLPDQDED